MTPYTPETPREIVRNTIARIVFLQESLTVGDIDTAYAVAVDLEADLVGYLERRAA